MIGEVLLCGAARSNEQRLLHYAEAYLRRELRCQDIRRSADPASRRGERVGGQREVEVALLDWQHQSANLLSFDRLFDSAQRDGDFRLVLWTPDWLDGVQAAYELLNRYQRLLPLPSDPPAMPQLGSVLAAHRQLYPLYDPQERAEHERALDAWRWTLRSPRPSIGLQLAALFQHVHAHGEVELLLASGAPFPASGHVGSIHAARSALAPLGFEPGHLRQLTELILGRGAAAASRDLTRLRDADDLSFFSVASWRYLEQHGHVATVRHVAQLLSRMSDTAVCLALMTRQPPEISRAIDEWLDSKPPPSGIRPAVGLPICS